MDYLVERKEGEKTVRPVHILTHPIGANYGGIMQAYALQHVLRTLGYSPVTMDIPFIYPRPLWRRFLSFGYHTLTRMLYHTPWRTRILQQHTDRFVQQHIVRTPRLGSEAELVKYYREHPAEAYVVGSDQVWRQQFVPMLSDFFFDFIPEADPVRRIAYAASFGVDPIDISPECIPRYAELLQRFVAISVREQSAEIVLREQFGCESQWVLDPTMLLTRAEYIEIFDLHTQPESRLFAYILDHSMEKLEIVQETAELHHANYRVFSPWHYWAEWGARLEDCILPPVEEWLEGILNAESVVTDSFHGVVFSLIFGKPFVGIVNKRRGCSRFDTLIESFGLESIEHGDLQLVMPPKEYPDDLEKVLGDYKSQSIAFLENALTS